LDPNYQAVGAFFVTQGMPQEGGGDVSLLEERLFNGTDEDVLDFKGYGRTHEQAICKQLVWPSLSKYIAFHKKMLDFSNDVKPKERRFLVVTGFGEQGLGNRIQWMTTFFWLAVITNRAILFEDDPNGKVLLLSDFLRSKHIDWVMTADIRKAMMDSGMPEPKRRDKVSGLQVQPVQTV
jgi:hypothetical protein